MKLAAIDIGSNAVRLLICSVQPLDNEVKFNKELLVRAPVRLGDQAFLDGKIHDNKIRMLTKSMNAFKNLIDVYKVDYFKAFATSAMREAKNHPKIVKEINKETGVLINVVAGVKEADTIFKAYSGMLKKQEHPTFMNIDVGGGSTEMVLFHKGKVVENKSFKIGTIRVLNDLVERDTWMAMKDWLKEQKSQYPNIHGLGSGGNIIKINKLYFQKPITLGALRETRSYLESFTLRERIQKLGLKPDRADVIVPASKIFCNVMEWGGIKKMFVPKIGLSDGIIQEVYEEYKDTKKGAKQVQKESAQNGLLAKELKEKSKEKAK